MLLFLIVLLVVAWIMYKMNTKSTYVSDENLIRGIVSNIRSKNPQLVPIETVSVDSGVARIMWFDTMNYSGQILDSTASGVLPRAPPIGNFETLEDKYMPFNDIQNFHNQF